MIAASPPLESASEASSAPDTVLPLSGLEPGQRARIVAVEGSDPASVRLQELGFLPGTEVLAVQRAPLGDPLLFEVRHTRLALREQAARCVRVVLLAPEQAHP